jgi:hypothetical protein
MLFPLVVLKTGGNESQGPLISVEATLRIFLRDQTQQFAAEIIKTFLNSEHGPACGFAQAWHFYQSAIF